MEQEQEIKDLVLRVVANEADAFRALYEHLVDKVYNYVKYRTSREDDALDLTQEVFVDLYKALPSFTYESTPQFYSFVFVITKRKLAKWYARLETSLDEQAVSFDENTISSAVSEDSETQDEICRALAELETETREIVVLHHWSRYTFKEIASLIQMTESAVRVRHHRALKTLSALIELPS
jgi:RNA polymerase sigma-70 factor (ECF subfamily)